jgi:hypothetical protein
LAVLAAFALSTGALAAEKAAAPIVPFSKDEIAAGVKDAGPVLAASGLACTIDQAAFAGIVAGKDAAGKATQDKAYEVSCKEGLGYLIVNSQPKPRFSDCLTLMANRPCRLPGNANPKSAIAQSLNQAGVQCELADAVGIGVNASGTIFFEVSCKNRIGFMLGVQPGKPPIVEGCEEHAGASSQCKLTTIEQIRAAERTAVQTLVTASGKACTIKDTRRVGRLTSGETVYEVSCSDGSGYMLEQKADSSLGNAIGCAAAESFAGGCKMTDATVTQTQEAATYTKLARASGFQCDVEKYHYVGMQNKSNSEVVELQCKNRPDGGIALFPADNSPGHVVDCVRAGFMQIGCHLTSPAAVYDRYTAALVSKGKTSCKVSNAAFLIHTAEGDDYVETACSDGLPGWVIEFSPSDQVVDLLSCGQARQIGQGCKLPGNVK